MRRNPWEMFARRLFILVAFAGFVLALIYESGIQNPVTHAGFIFCLSVLCAFLCGVIFVASWFLFDFTFLDPFRKDRYGEEYPI